MVTVQFLRKPQDSKIYKSDEYEKLVDRLLIESRGIALQKILERKELALSDFSELKKGIETDISKLTTELKKKFLPNQDIVSRRYPAMNAKARDPATTLFT